MVPCVCICQLEQIGEYFQRQLLQSRHRGAFELAYAGFVKMTHTLWRSRIAAAHCLPDRWLSQLMSKVRGHDPDDELCSTRRSAGVPFFVQVLAAYFVLPAGRSVVKIGPVHFQARHFVRRTNRFVLFISCYAWPSVL